MDQVTTKRTDRVAVADLIDKVRSQITSSTLRKQWSQPVVAVASRVRRTYLSKREFRKLLHAVGVDLDPEEYKMIWNEMVDELSAKLPLDVFINQCIVSNHPQLESEWEWASSRRVSTGRSLEDISKTMFTFIHEKAERAHRERLASVGRADGLGTKGYDLHKAYVAVFCGRKKGKQKRRERFEMADLDEALKLCGYRGSLQLSYNEVYKVFREMDPGRRGYVDFHSFSVWFVQQQQRQCQPSTFWKDEGCGVERTAAEGIWKEEPCWKQMDIRRQAAEDAGLQWVVLDHLRRCQDEGCFEDLSPDHDGKVGFVQVLNRCVFKEKTDLIKSSLKRILNVDADANVSWQRWKEVMNTRSMFHPDTFQRNPVARSDPEKDISALVFQSRNEALAVATSTAPTHPCVPIHDYDQDYECPHWIFEKDRDVLEGYSSTSSASSSVSMTSNGETLDDSTNTSAGTGEDAGAAVAVLDRDVDDDVDHVEEKRPKPEERIGIDFEERMEEESKAEEPKETIQRKRVVEVVGVCIRRNDLQSRRPPTAVLLCKLMPWGITSSFSTESGKGIWSCWSDSRRRCLSKGASMRMNYPMDQIPIVLNPGASPVSIEGRVRNNRPHVLVKVFLSRPKRVPFARGRRLHLIGQDRINLGRYLHGAQTVKNAVETITVAEYQVQLRLSWVEKPIES